MVIGICGGSGSGKTTLLKRLSQKYAHLAPSIFSMDNYYKPKPMQFVDANGEVNFDLPDSLYREKLVADLQKLVNGEAIERIEYHFNSPPDKHILITTDPSELIIVEGLFSFHYPEVKALIELSIFVDVDLDVQLDRRLYRDQETRGYTHEAIMYQWTNHVVPCYENYLLPYRKDADFLFRNDVHAEEDFKSLVELIDNQLQNTAKKCEANS